MMLGHEDTVGVSFGMSIPTLNLVIVALPISGLPCAISSTVACTPHVSNVGMMVILTGSRVKLRLPKKNEIVEMWSQIESQQ